MKDDKDGKIKALMPMLIFITLSHKNNRRAAVTFVPFYYPTNPSLITQYNLPVQIIIWRILIATPFQETDFFIKIPFP